MAVIILTMPNQRRIERLKVVMEVTAPGYQHTYSVTQSMVDSKDYNLRVHAVPEVQREEENRIRNFAKGIIAGWECLE